MEGRGLPAKAAFPDSFSYGNEAVETVSYDPEGAKKLLEESGWKDTDGDGYADKDGQKLTIDWLTSVSYTHLAALLLLTALCAKYICPYDPYEQNLLLAKQPPGPEHLLGTDRYGRDMFSRILTGGTTSIFSTLILVSITTVTGTFVGIICGWRGGFVDAFLMRISDLFLAFPSLVFALAVAGVLEMCIRDRCRGLFRI